MSLDFEETVEKYYEDVYRFVFMMLKDRNNAADVTQETFIMVERYLKNFQGNSSVRTWLYRIASNEVKKFYKRQKRAQNIKVPQKEKYEENYTDLKAAMEKLDKESYEILFLKFFKRMSEKEMAFILNIPEGTVKSRIFNAKEKLRKVVKNGR